VVDDAAARQHTRTTSGAPRRRWTNIVTASTITASKLSSSDSSCSISPRRTSARSSTPTRATVHLALARFASLISSASTSQSSRRAICAAVVPMPQPASSTR
jgi:hypothetical protein